MTNGDRIRQMSNEELAEFIDENFGDELPCRLCSKPRHCCNSDCAEGIKACLDMEIQE